MRGLCFPDILHDHVRSRTAKRFAVPLHGAAYTKLKGNAFVFQCPRYSRFEKKAGGVEIAGVRTIAAGKFHKLNVLKF